MSSCFAKYWLNADIYLCKVLPERSYALRLASIGSIPNFAYVKDTSEQAASS